MNNNTHLIRKGVYNHEPIRRIKKNLGANIKRYRRQKGKSMEEFAEEICTPARPSKRWRPAQQSQARTLEVISKSLDVSPQLLLSSPAQIEMYTKEYALLEQIQAFAAAVRARAERIYRKVSAFG